MPIRPENMLLYPGGSTRSKEWAAIRAFIRARAGDTCEECGVKNGQVGVRIGGVFYPLVDQLTEPGARVMHEGFVVFRIVCTVAHMDRGLTDHSAGNLKFLCQRCHNRHDAKDRAAGVRARRNQGEKT